MRSRAARLISSAFALLALGGAAFFVITTEQTIAARRTALRAFDQRGREASFALADARTAQQAYVAAGQSPTVWMSRVASLLTDARATVDRLRELATSAGSQSALVDAAATITEFGNIDRRARDYLRTNEDLMASDVVFTEGGVTVEHAIAQVETARLSEQDALDVYEKDQHRLTAYAAAGAAGVTTLALLLLVLSPSMPSTADTQLPASTDQSSDVSLRETAVPAPARGELTGVDASAIGPDETLQATAQLCTEFGRMHDVAELQTIVGRAAQLMDASGLVVWLAGPGGADLEPVVAHGYTDHVLSLMKPVPRTADNAVAAAYRSGTPQIVGAKPGTASGAVVAPLLSPEGCVGALTAEIRHGNETSNRVQALASIFAAQLAGVLAPPEATAARSDARTA